MFGMSSPPGWGRYPDARATLRYEAIGFGVPAAKTRRDALHGLPTGYSYQRCPETPAVPEYAGVNT
jgi:hypothetical protein